MIINKKSKISNRNNFIRDNRVYLEETSKKDLKSLENIHSDIFSLLKKVFGRKSETELISDFENNFIRTKYLSKKHLNYLNEINLAIRKGLGKEVYNKYKKSRFLKDKATILLNDLFGHFKQDKLIPRGLERDRMKDKIKLYSKSFSKTELFLRDFIRRSNFLLNKSDEKILSTFFNLKKNAEKLHNKIEEMQEGQNKKRFLKRIVHVNGKLSSKEKTSKRLVDHISQDLNKSYKERKIKALV